MIVQQIGYIKKEGILDMIAQGVKFSLYKTRKNTCILVKDATSQKIDLFYPKKDRLPYKVTEGKKIISGVKVFDSQSPKDVLDNNYWNNGNQVMSYEAFDYKY